MVDRIGGAYRFNGKVCLNEAAFREVRHFRHGEEIFVCGRSDIFHHDVPSEYIARIIACSRQRPDCTFFAITKRPQRFREFMEFPGNFWVSISVENQAAADLRIPHLTGVRGKRIISAKPLLGGINFGKHWDNIDMIIVGGEYGSKARPMFEEWPRHIRDQCIAAGRPFSFHNWGLWLPGEGRITRWVNDVGQIHRAVISSSRPMHMHEEGEDGSCLDGVIWDQYPA